MTATRRIIAALVVSLLAVSTACSDSDEDGSSATTTPPTSADDDGRGTGEPLAPQPLAERTTVTVAMAATIEAFATVLVADALGELEKENLEVDIQVLPTNDGTLLLSQGRVDVQLTGTGATPFNLVADGADLRYVASVFVEDAAESGFWIRKELVDDEGPSAEELEAVIFGLGGGGLGNPGALGLYQWLLEQDVDPLDLRAETVTSAQDAALALQNGRVQAGIVLTPLQAQVEASGCCEFLVPSVPNGGFMARGAWLEESPDVAEAFFRAMARTNRDHLAPGYKDDDAVVDALAEAMGQPRETVADAPELGFSEELELVLADHIEAFQQMFRAAEVLSYDEDLRPEDIVDTSVIDRALE